MRFGPYKQSFVSGMLAEAHGRSKSIGVTSAFSDLTRSVRTVECGPSDAINRLPVSSVPSANLAVTFLSSAE